MSGGPDVELRVGELALHGVPIARPDAVGLAFEAAMTRLLDERGVPDGWFAGEVGAPQGSLTVALDGSDSPEVFAQRLAAAVYEGLGG